jgi:chemotaxis protein methyltransferase CheR
VTVADPLAAPDILPSPAETFFGDVDTAAALEHLILPQLIAARRQQRQLRIWCIGIQTGALPYRIAIALRRLLPDHAEWRLGLLASTADAGALQRARAGQFQESCFTDAPTGFRQRHFRRHGNGGWSPLPQVRRMVDFIDIDLRRDAFPSLLNRTSAIDLIVCRTPLHGDGAPGDVASGRLAQCLGQGGWLLSGADMPPIAGLSPVARPNVHIFRRDADAAAGNGPPGRVDCDAADTALSYTLALHDYREGRYAQAARRLRADLGVRALDGRHLDLLARIEALQGHLVEALAWNGQALALAPSSPESHRLRACILQEQGAFGEAMQACQRAIYLDPSCLLGHFGLGMLARRLGRGGEAERHFASAAALALRLPADEELADADPVTAGRLLQIIASLRAG